MTATSVHPSETSLSHPRGTIPTLAFIGSVLFAAFSGGMAAGYYGYAQDITSGDPFVIWLWFVLLPLGAFVLSWWPGKLLGWNSGTLLIAPIITLLGFWAVYRHPDLWTAGLLSAVASAVLCSMVFSMGWLFQRWKPSWASKLRWLHWIFAASAIAYATTAITFLARPLNIEYEPYTLGYKGQGVLNGASTDVAIAWRDPSGAYRGYFCDGALRGDLMSVLSVHGYPDILSGSKVDPRKTLGGPLLGFLPIRDPGFLGN